MCVDCRGYLGAVLLPLQGVCVDCRGYLGAVLLPLPVSITALMDSCMHFMVELEIFFITAILIIQLMM